MRASVTYPKRRMSLSQRGCQLLTRKDGGACHDEGVGRPRETCALVVDGEGAHEMRGELGVRTGQGRS
jgi:hypothetical protein